MLIITFKTAYTANNLDTFVPHKVKLSHYEYYDIDRKNPIFETEVTIAGIIECNQTLLTSRDVTELFQINQFAPYSLYFDGTEGIDAAYFKDFDYVALGHLHNPQYVNRHHIRYSGSILKYSDSEAGVNKVALMVELKEKGNIEITELPLTPLHDLKKIKGTIDELLVNPDVLDEDYVYVTLTNDTIIPYAMKRIRVKYPNALSLTYERLSKQLIDKTIDTTDFKEKSIKDQFKEFYKFINNKELSDNQISILDKILEKVEEK